MNGEDLQALSRRVRERYVRALAERPVLRTLTYSFDMPLAGDGWHTRESKGAHHWRFTGPGERASLYLPRCAAYVRAIVLDVFLTVSEAHVEQLEVSFNGIPLPGRRRDGKGIIFSIPPEATAALPYTLLEFVTPPAVQPSARDDRKLGVAFSAITIA